MGGSQKPYETVVIDYAPKAAAMAAAMGEKANEMARQGFVLVTFSVTDPAKAILVFRSLEGSDT